MQLKLYRLPRFLANGIVAVHIGARIGALAAAD
jgi:hypothetical protein